MLKKQTSSSSGQSCSEAQRQPVEKRLRRHASGHERASQPRHTQVPSVSPATTTHSPPAGQSTRVAQAPARHSPAAHVYPAGHPASVAQDPGGWTTAKHDGGCSVVVVVLVDVVV